MVTITLTSKSPPPVGNLTVNWGLEESIPQSGPWSLVWSPSNQSLRCGHDWFEEASTGILLNVSTAKVGIFFDVNGRNFGSWLPKKLKQPNDPTIRLLKITSPKKE